jgi:hypothetical protein
MGGIFRYLYYFFVNIICILTLESNFILFFVLGFGAQQRRLLLHMQFNLRLNIINYLFIIMQQKL